MIFLLICFAVLLFFLFIFVLFLNIPICIIPKLSQNYPTNIRKLSENCPKIIQKITTFFKNYYNIIPNFFLKLSFLGREEEKLRRRNEEYLLVNFPCDVRKNLRGILLAADKEAAAVAAAAKEAATAADKEAVAAAEAVKKAAKAPTPSGADKKPIAAAKTSEQIGGRLEKPPPPNQKPPSPAHKPVGPNRKGT